MQELKIFFRNKYYHNFLATILFFPNSFDEIEYFAHSGLNLVKVLISNQIPKYLMVNIKFQWAPNYES